MSKKKGSYRCTVCGKMHFTKKELIKHYRDKHPEYASKLYETIGTTGDKFSDKFISGLWQDNFKFSNDLSVGSEQYKILQAAYNKLVFECNQHKNAITSITAIIDNVNTSVEVVQNTTDVVFPM